MLLDSQRSLVQDNYIIIYSYFINKDYKFIYCLLGFKKVYRAKSGLIIIEIIAKVINNYKIGQNLSIFIIDNTRDNNTILKELVTRFNINVDYLRLRCLSYIINLIVKALLFSKGVSKLKQKLTSALYNKVFKIQNSIGLISKLYNIYVYVNFNLTRQAVFRDYQGEGIQIYQLLIDRGIRWNLIKAIISRGMLYIPNSSSSYYTNKYSN